MYTPLYVDQQTTSTYPANQTYTYTTTESRPVNYTTSTTQYGNYGSYGGTTTTYNAGGYSGAGYVNGGSRAERVVAEEIPVESRIEYIPFEKKYIEYDKVERIERIPYEREIIEYE